MLISKGNTNFRKWESGLMEIQVRPHNEGSILYIDDDNNFQITIVPDTGTNEAYIKICNNIKYIRSTKSIRLSFFKSEYIPYDGDRRSLLELTQDELAYIMNILNDESLLITNWRVACHMWNIECGFAYHPDYDNRLAKGCIENSKLLTHPQYVPLDTQMPDYTKIKFN